MPTALLTGVGRRRGIAAGIAAGLAQDGWDLALSYWQPYDERLGLEGGADDPESLADELARKEIAVQGLIVNRTQPSFGVALGDGAGEGTDGPVRVALSGSAVRARAETLAGTALGDHYRCLADSLHLAAGEAEHLAGLAERVTPAPVVKVPVQPFEVSDLESLRTLAAVVFADTSDGYGAGDSDAQQAHD